MKKNIQGFTIVELMVVIAIIALLAALSVVGVQAARAKANNSKVQHDLEQIRKAMDTLGNDTGMWPGGQEINEINTVGSNEICANGCTQGLSSPTSGLIATDGSFDNWSGPYMQEMPLDPWGHEYFFDTDYRIKTSAEEPCNASASCQDAAVLGSYGPDGEGNNLYNGDDIVKVLAK